MELEELKAYCRIDYDDDDEVIKLIYAAVGDEVNGKVEKLQKNFTSGK